MNNKKIKKILGMIALFSFIAIVSTACARTTGTAGQIKPPSSGPYGFIFRLIGKPFQHMIEGTATMIGGKNGFALGIIIISFLVRLVLLPLGLNQQYKATTQQEKMKAIQPQMKLVQEKTSEAKSQQAQMEMSQLMMKIYRENGVSLMGGMGCLPLLLQFPVLIGIYQAVQFSPNIASSTFLNIPLGKPNLIIAVVATIFYVIQSNIYLKSLPEEQQKQSKMMLYMSPLMTLFISMFSSAALALYFLVGGIIILIQQLIVTYIIQPKIKKAIDEDLVKNPIKQVVTEESLNAIIEKYDNNNSTTDTSTTTPSENPLEPSPSVNESDASKRARNKNKGIQQKRNK